MPEHKMPYHGPQGYAPYSPQYSYHPYPQYQSVFPPHHSPPMPYIQQLTVQSQNGPFISSPSVAVQLHVSLSEFCTHYHISSVDRKKLQNVIEYQPRDKLVENLLKKTWGKARIGLSSENLGGLCYLLLIGSFVKMQRQACGLRRMFSYSFLMISFLIATLLPSCFAASYCLTFITYHCVFCVLYLLS